MQALELGIAQLKSGDLIFFAGSGRRSALIKRFTRSKWSHIGMVLHLDAFPYPLLFESTAQAGAVDIERREIVSGVQIVPLKQRIAAYPGEVAVRSLDQPPSAQRYAALLSLREELRGRPYERCSKQLFRSAYDGPIGTNRCDLSSIFCSELVALAYQRMGYLGEEYPPNEYTPHDFSEAGGLVLKEGPFPTKF
ncbi:hypothetical protein [Litchfieldella xinjiangensis]|uniref:hypothetical protein n=1 Tax=Litchfieldella xinjiangensis TaxID=1166948 RepID=UPI000693D787|nr:hypothetical protein [Halomonas xinjiangensis]